MFFLMHLTPLYPIGFPHPASTIRSRSFKRGMCVIKKVLKIDYEHSNSKVNKVSSKKRNILYYAHPLELYNTYMETSLESALRRETGNVYHIKDLPHLRDGIDKNGQNTLENLYDKMRKATLRPDLSKEGAENIARTFSETLRASLTADPQNILFNPSTFSSFERFMSMSFPHFCQALIRHFDVVIAHGYPLNEKIKRLLHAWLSLGYSKKEIGSYVQRIREIISNSRNMVWSPGVVKELEHGLKKGIKTFVFLDGNLQKASEKDLEEFRKREVPFDRYNLNLYNKVWQPISKHVYSTLTELCDSPSSL